MKFDVWDIIRIIIFKENTDENRLKDTDIVIPALHNTDEKKIDLQISGIPNMESKSRYIVNENLVFHVYDDFYDYKGEKGNILDNAEYLRNYKSLRIKEATEDPFTGFTREIYILIFYRLNNLPNLIEPDNYPQETTILIEDLVRGNEAELYKSAILGD